MKIPPPFARLYNFLSELVTNYGKDDAFTLGAALAYYTVFSFAPMLVIIISVSSWFAGREAVTGQLYRELNQLFGPDTAATFQEIVGNAYSSGDTFWATLIGTATLLFTATTVFNALKNSLNRIWGLQSQPSNLVAGLMLDRFLSFGMVLVLGFMLLVTLVINAVVVGFVEQIAQFVPLLGSGLLKVFTLVIDWILTSVIIASLFRFLPDARARWRDIWVGAIFTGFLFLVGKFLIGLYIGNSNFSSTYGAAGALVTLLIWTYYNAQIIFLGAEFTWVWARRSGHAIEPNEYAVHIRQETVTISEAEAQAEAEAAARAADESAQA